MIDCLCGNGADVNVQDADYGYTPFFFAATNYGMYIVHGFAGDGVSNLLQL
jgi:hypothetical protein